MPPWGQVVLLVASLILAGHTIWSKFIRPGAGLVSTMDKFLPVASKLADEFAQSPELLATISEIARQFRPNRGSSLRDVIDRLDARIETNTKAIEAVARQLTQIHEDLRKRGTA